MINILLIFLFSLIIHAGNLSHIKTQHNNLVQLQIGVPISPFVGLLYTVMSAYTHSSPFKTETGTARHNASLQMSLVISTVPRIHGLSMNRALCIYINTELTSRLKQLPHVQQVCSEGHLLHAWFPFPLVHWFSLQVLELESNSDINSQLLFLLVVSEMYLNYSLINLFLTLAIEI